jgi:hypothetical protein
VSETLRVARTGWANVTEDEQAESGRVTHPFEPVILAATLLMIPVLIIQRDAKSDGWQTFASVANWAIWAVFAMELAFVLIVAPRKRAALRAHWLDVAIVAVTAPLYGQILSSLRLVRLMRLMRLARAAVVISRALQAERRLTVARVCGSAVDGFCVISIPRAGLSASHSTTLPRTLSVAQPMQPLG